MVLPRVHQAVLVMLILSAPLSAQTVTLSLLSAQGGMVVSPGTTINWSIACSVSTGNNAGLALVLADLVQAPENPAKLDIPPATSVPVAMHNFSRPQGISNPGESGQTSGYVGVQRGTVGQKNLRQIGGAQNTFGKARPQGSGLAENAIVVGGVGQQGLVIVATGSFAAPAAAGGYTFRIENAVANVLSTLNPVPQVSAVVTAAIATPAGSFSFTVSGVPCNACDANCDTATNGADIRRFVGRLLSQSSACSPCAGDMNGDGQVTTSDIPAFITCLLGA